MTRIDKIKIKLSDYSPFPFFIRQASLTFILDPEKTFVTARLFIDRRRLENQPPSSLWLDGEGLTLLELKLDGKVLPEDAYGLDRKGLTIFNVPDQFELETKVAISPKDNTALLGLYMSGGRYCTRCEAEGFRRITFWPDRPDVMSRFQVRVEAEKARFPVLLSNGNRMASGELDEGRHWVEWDDPHPKPSYLFALVAGSFDTIEDRFTTMNGRQVGLAIYVEKGQGGRALYAMDALKRAMVWDEEVYGRAYDLDVYNCVAVSDFNGGAMENKGLNIFNSALLMADEQTATDADYGAIESVVAHEYFHNWSGNRVTCRDWFQLSLKEGFTVFRDQEFSADQRSRAVQRIKDVKVLRSRQFAEDSGPLAHPVRPDSYVKIDNFYTATVYEKGAELIRVVQSLIGEQAFSRGADLYFDDNDGRAATIEDWLSAMRKASGLPLKGFEHWYDQAGTPVVNVSCSHDGDAETFALQFTQITPPTPDQPIKTWVPIPIRLAFFDTTGTPMRLRIAGNQIPVDEWLIPFSSETLTVVFEGAKTRPIPSLLRGFSAPVRLEIDRSDEDLSILAAFDSDAFVRWESTQNLARKIILNAADSISQGRTFDSGDALPHALLGAMRQGDSDPAFAALMLRLPDVGELMQYSQECDPESLHEARQLVRETLCHQLNAPLNAAFAAYDPAQAFSPSAEAAGRRALASACLDLLTASLHDRAALRAENFFFAARTMTDMMAALESLALIGGPRFEAALQAFRQRFSDNPLVMDKWFRVQAMATSGDGIATFNRLRQDSAFNLFNPNRVRSLGGAFAAGNPKSFHRKDGAGYRVMADLIADIDARNGAIAARLCTLFESTARVEVGRRQLASKAVTGLLERPALSANSREILNKISLAIEQPRMAVS